jgi:hypothetical protein
MLSDIPTCRRLLRHCVTRAFCLAVVSEGKIMLARMLMIAMTTNSSIKVKADVQLFFVARASSLFLVFIFPYVSPTRFALSRPLSHLLVF